MVWVAAFAALAASACATTPASETPAAPSAPAAAPAAPARAAAVPATPPGAFAVCGACHGTSAGAPPSLGPNLFGVAGKKAGSVAGYDYSDAMKGSSVVWTAANLQAFVREPNKVIPGNNMDYPGVPDDATAKAIADYMATLK
jgi:cytochrome c